LPERPSGFTAALAERLDELRRERGSVMVGIDGRGAMGKSTVARKLAGAAGAEVLELDAFFYPPARHPPFDPSRIDHLRVAELAATLAALRAGEAAEYRPYDWEIGDVGAPVAIRPGFVVVEGLYALRAELGRPYDFTIWVEGELSQRMERVFQRSGNGVSRQAARADPFARLWIENFGPREQAYIEAERPWEIADLVVAGAGLSISDAGRQFLTPAPCELSPEPPPAL
jgi:uridine kinase